MRRGAILIAVLVALTLAATGCGGDGDDETTTPASAVTEYVGAVTGADTGAHLTARPGDYYVAVAINESGEVEAYMCDGAGNSELFSGTVEDDQLDLNSDSGKATLTATVSDSTIEGEVAVEGETLQFTAEEAQQQGGLYTVSVSKDGRTYRAESEGGRVLQGETSGDGTELISTFTPAGGGEPQEFVQPTLQDGRSGPFDGKVFEEYRVVRLDNGHSRGNPTIGAGPLTQAQLGTAPSRPRVSDFRIICLPQ